MPDFPSDASSRYSFTWSKVKRVGGNWSSERKKYQKHAGRSCSRGTCISRTAGRRNTGFMKLDATRILASTCSPRKLRNAFSRAPTSGEIAPRLLGIDHSWHGDSPTRWDRTIRDVRRGIYRPIRSKRLVGPVVVDLEQFWIVGSYSLENIRGCNITDATEVNCEK